MLELGYQTDVTYVTVTPRIPTPAALKAPKWWCGGVVRGWWGGGSQKKGGVGVARGRCGCGARGAAPKRSAGVRCGWCGRCAGVYKGGWCEVVCRCVGSSAGVVRGCLHKKKGRCGVGALVVRGWCGSVSKKSMVVGDAGVVLHRWMVGLVGG